MVFRIVVVLAVTVLAVAPQAFAWGGGGRGSSTAVSGNFSSSSGQSGTFAINCSGPNCSGTITNGGNTGNVNGSVTVATPEPLAALAAGLGLLGARYLRRRR